MSPNLKLSIASLALSTLLAAGCGRSEPTSPTVKPVVAQVVVASVADAGTPVVDEVDHAARATDLLNDGDAEGALTELRLAAKQKPDDVEVHRRIALLDKGDDGVAAAKEVARLTPNDAEPWREVARREIERKHWNEAIAAAQHATAMEPAVGENQVLEGRAQMGKGRLGLAAVSFRRATTMPGATGSTWNFLGYALLMSNRPEDALEAFDAAIDHGPVTHQMMNNLGLAYEKLGRLEDAELAFLGALELNKHYVKAEVNLDRIAKLKEELAKAEAAVEPDSDDEAPTAAAKVEEVPALVPPTEPTQSGGDPGATVHGG